MVHRTYQPILCQCHFTYVVYVTLVVYIHNVQVGSTYNTDRRLIIEIVLNHSYIITINIISSYETWKPNRIMFCLGVHIVFDSRSSIYFSIFIFRTLISSTNNTDRYSYIILINIISSLETQKPNRIMFCLCVGVVVVFVSRSSIYFSIFNNLPSS